MRGSIEKGSSLRVLILRSRHKSEIENKREAKIFANMAKALEAASLRTNHGAIRFERDLNNAIAYEEPDIVFDALSVPEHTNDQMLGIGRVLRERGFAYIGTDIDALARRGSQSDLHERWRSLGIGTPWSYSIRKYRDGSTEGMGYTGNAIEFPCSIRPDTGIESLRERFTFLASSSNELRRKVIQLTKRFDRIIVQQSLEAQKDARFFSVARIGNSDRQILMPAELRIAKGMLLQSVTARDILRRRVRIEPIADKGTKDELLRVARAALDAAEVKDFARLDMASTGGKFYAVDLKVQPQVPDPLFDACASIAGLSEEQRTIAIFLTGFARLFIEGRAFIAIPSKVRSTLPKSVFSVLYG